MFAKFFFIYCALMILGTGVLAISLRNPVHSLLMVLVLFFHMAGLYLTLNAEFLAAVQIIVYAGAILVLYLFVMFLVNIREELRINSFVNSAWLGRLIAAGLAVMLVGIIPAFTLGTKGHWPLSAVKEVTHTKALGIEMYSTYIFPFEIAGLILLIAVVGGLVLAKNSSQSDSQVEASEVNNQLEETNR